MSWKHIAEHRERSQKEQKQRQKNVKRSSFRKLTKQLEPQNCSPQKLFFTDLANQASKINIREAIESIESALCHIREAPIGNNFMSIPGFQSGGLVEHARIQLQELRTNISDGMNTLDTIRYERERLSVPASGSITVRFPTGGISDLEVKTHSCSKCLYFNHQSRDPRDIKCAINPSIMDSSKCPDYEPQELLPAPRQFNGQDIEEVARSFERAFSLLDGKPPRSIRFG